MKKKNQNQLYIFVFNALYLFIFTFIFIHRANYEFLGYVGVVFTAALLIIISNKKMNYPNSLLWGLSIWGLLHMLGGGVVWESGRLYDLILYPISEKYEILKYDQFTHIIGFAVATVLMYSLLIPHIKLPTKRWVSLSVVVIMAGLGVGCVNEIIEFSATIITNNNGVGGYLNTSLDLISNLIGCIIAMIYIRAKKGKL